MHLPDTETDRWGSDRKVNEEESDRKIRRMLSRSSGLRDILSKTMSDHETEAVYSGQNRIWWFIKKNTKDLTGRFLYTGPSSYFFAQI